jgi:menaquinone-dependent protoporphyrinogen oxidase
MPTTSLDPMEETTRVLVGYATAAGSTTGIAERIATTLRHTGSEVVCRPVGPDVDPTSFDAFVLGSAVHNMAWLQPAVDFLGRLPSADERPIWCFSVGGGDDEGPVVRRMAALEVRRVERASPAGFHAREHRLFRGVIRGVIEMKGVPLWGRIFWRLIGGRPGDHRNWPAIDRWASGVGTEITRMQKAAGQRHD